MSPEAVIRRLDVACQKWWFFTLLTTTVLAGCLCFAFLLSLMTVDAFVRFNQIGLAVALGVWLTTTLALAVVVGRRLLRNHRGLEGAARRVEAEFPELGSRLDQHRPTGRRQTRRGSSVPRGGRQRRGGAGRTVPFRLRGQPAVSQAAFPLLHADAARSGRVALPVGDPRRRRLGLPPLHSTWGSAASRLMAPWQFVPAVGKVEILRVSPGDDPGDGRRRAGSRRRDQQPRKTCRIPAACC